MAQNWRGRPSEPAGKPKAVPRRSSGWRKEAAAGPAGDPSRTRRRLLGLVGSLAVGGGLVALLLLPGCDTTRLYVAVPDYPDVFASPALSAAAESQGLTALDRKSGGVPNVTATALRPDADALAAAAKIPDDDVLAVYLSAAVMPDGGEGYVVAGGEKFSPDAPTKAVGCDALIEPLVSRIRRGGKTLVLLDLARPEANWRAGVLAPLAGGRLLERLDRELREAGPGRKAVVLASCTPGERSHVLDGRSVFSRAVAEGLRGGADRDGNRRVTAAELVAFVKDRTTDRVRRLRDPAGQHPVSLPAAIPADADFDVASLAGAATPAREQDAAPVPSGVIDRLTAAYAARDDLAAATPPGYHDQPIRWRKLGALLSRAEAFVLAGRGDAATKLVADAEAVIGDLRGAVPPPRASLPSEPPADRLARFREAAPDATAGEFEAVVETRRTAERAATAMPRAILLLGPALARADATRREAEDLVFVGDVAAVGTRREAAEAAYVDAEARAADYVTAVAASERLLAELPGLAAWAAGQPVSDALLEGGVSAVRNATGDRAFPPAAPGGSADALVGRVAGLFAAASGLLADLRQVEALAAAKADVAATDAPPGEAADVSARLRRLRSDATTATATLDAVRSELAAEAEALLKHGQTESTQGLDRRQRVVAVLAFPDLPAADRKRLWAALREIDATLARETAEAGKSSPAAAKTDLAAAADRALRGAAWQGFWAAEAVGLSPNADAKELWTVWASLAGPGRPVEERRAAAARLGGRVRETWAEAARLVGTSFFGHDDSPRAAFVELVRRDRLARCVHGYDAADLAEKLKDPARELAELSRTELALFLARRYADDFYAGDSDDAPWFAAAAGDCLAAAGGTTLKTVRDRVYDLRELVARRAAVRFRLTAADIFFGTAAEKPADVRIDVTGGEPPAGRAALWLTADATGRVRLPETGRKAVPIASGASSESAVAFRLGRGDDSGDCAAVDLPARLFYRGHGGQRGAAVAVDPCKPRGLVRSYAAAPSRGEVVVEGADRRSVLFVLDCSGSMSYVVGSDREAGKGEKSRFDVAKATLTKTIGELARQSRAAAPIRVGLWAFGHRYNTRKAGGSWIDVPNPAWSDPPEWTDPYGRKATAVTDVQELVPLGPLGDAQRETLLGQLGRLGPYGITPLVAAIQSSTERLIGQQVPAALVVITDGADTIAQNPGGRNTLQSRIAQVAGRLKSAGVPVEVHVVGFSVNDADRELLQDLEKTGGTFSVAPDAATLTESIEAAIRPRPWSVTPLDRRSDAEEHALGEPAPLPPGRYRIAFPAGAADATTQEIALSGGERLTIGLQDGRLSPLKYQSDPKPKRDVPGIADGGPPKVGPNALVHRSYRVDPSKNEAEFVVSLDRADERTGFVPRPEFVRFRVGFGPDGAVAETLSWELRPGSAPPTWTIRTSAPPGGDRRARLTAWWRMRAENADRTFVPEDAGPSGTGQEVVVPTAAGEVRLRLARFVRRTDRATVEVRFEPAGPTPDAAARQELVETLLRLGTTDAAGTFVPADVNFTRRDYPEEGTIEIEFKPEAEDAAAVLGLTFPGTWRTGAAEASIDYTRDDP